MDLEIAAAGHDRDVRQAAKVVEPVDMGRQPVIVVLRVAAADFDLDWLFPAADDSIIFTAAVFPLQGDF